MPFLHAVKHEGIMHGYHPMDTKILAAAKEEQPSLWGPAHQM